MYIRTGERERERGGERGRERGREGEGHWKQCDSIFREDG